MRRALGKIRKFSLPRIGRILAAALLAVSGVKAQTYTDPATAPEEFRVQGEYIGDITGGGRLGAWVAALGGDNYQVSFLPGGLVGMGWDNKTRVKGQTTSGNISVAGYTGKITGTGTDRTLAGKTPDGKAFTLKRITRQSPTLGLAPPTGAKVLYGNKAASDAANWTPSDRVDRGTGYLMWGVKSKAQHKNIQLHIEVLTPFKPTGRGQDRGNSGIYLQDRYEMQVLESFGLDGLADELGGIYSLSAPLVNAALPPLTWQTYDCYFKEPVWGASGKTKNATMTVYLNGILVQKDVEVTRTTTAAGLNEGASAGPIQLQNHGNPVHYNNIWMIEGNGIPWEQLLPVPIDGRLDRPAEGGFSLVRRGGLDWVKMEGVQGNPAVKVFGMNGACLAVLQGGRSSGLMALPRLAPGSYFLSVDGPESIATSRKFTILP